LSAEINAATRYVPIGTIGTSPKANRPFFLAPNSSQHTALNKLITSRIPLGLPPYADNPAAYTFGLRSFAHVYLAFESVFHDLARPPSAHNQTLSALLDESLLVDGTASVTATGKLTPELHGFLYTLLPAGMTRSRRLLADLAALERRRPSEIEVSLRRYPGAAVETFCEQIQRSARARPWVLVAYSWVFYMAIFSGGRWIRAQLRDADEEFWRAGSEEVEGEDEKGELEDEEEAAASDEEGEEEEDEDGDDEDADERRAAARYRRLPLSFLDFPGNEDGEDIKREFKQRLLCADELLTADQREDVIAEAREIFDSCIAIVKELDETCGTEELLKKAADYEKKSKSDTKGEGEKKKEKGKKVGFVPPQSVLAVGKNGWPAVEVQSVAGVAILLSCLSLYAYTKASM